jgi:hypothetical protein
LAAAASKQIIFDLSEKPRGLLCAVTSFSNALDRQLATTALRETEKSAFLGLFGKLRNETVGFVTRVSASSAWNSSSPTGRIFLKFHISGFFENFRQSLSLDKI